MRKNVSTLLVIAGALCGPAAALEVGRNVSVLPLVAPQGPTDTEWFKLGDGYLQRQLEPTIVSSTRNPDHLLAFFNDYRAVDAAIDGDLGTTQDLAVGMAAMRTLLAAAWGLRLPATAPPEVFSAAEAWVGMSRSYDGGLTWSGGFVPGAPFDDSPASLGSPIYGLEAATDPVAACGPCGQIYVAFVAFTRGGASKLVVARYEDLNNDEGGDTIVYRGMTVVDSANKATNGRFIDKPYLAVDVDRTGSSDSCAQRVYVSYSVFTGKQKPGKFNGAIYLASSSDGAASFRTTKISNPYTQNQGSVIAIDPRPGRPNRGGGTVYVLWRHFFDPDLILMASSTDYGKKFSKPSAVTGGGDGKGKAMAAAALVDDDAIEPAGADPDELVGFAKKKGDKGDNGDHGEAAAMYPFDQPTINTTIGNPVTDVAFRSNAFPTAAVTGDGTLFAAWQERVAIDVAETDPDFGRPAELGSPRIVVVRSSDGGKTWRDVTGAKDERLAVDFGDRDADPASRPKDGLGALPQVRPSGPQVMPTLEFGGGRLLLTYLESRGLLGPSGVQPTDLSETTGFISGIDRVVDLRAALLDPTTGELLDTTQVSRYPLSAAADLTDGESLDDIAPINWPCSPDAGGGHPPCVRQVGRANLPTSDSGRAPFIGDYNDATPIVQFVPEDDGDSWRWATEPGDVPSRGFRVLFADNRHSAPPTEPAGALEWERYQSYIPPGTGALPCVNAGAKNTDVFTARVDAELVISAPTTYKQLSQGDRSFPLSVSNQTAENRFYRLAIGDGADRASFSRSDDIDSGDVEIFPYSSVSQVVYVEANTPGPIRVTIAEVDAINGDVVDGGQTGAITFNGDPSNPEIGNISGDEVQNPFVLNPFVLNPFVLNPFVLNQGAPSLSAANPFVLNPFVLNPFVLNSTIYDVVDTTWEVTPGGGNTATSFLPLVNVDNADEFVGNYAFQLIVYRRSAYAALDGCAAVPSQEDQILSNVVQDPTSGETPFVLNPFVLNPFVLNPFVLNPFVLNSTFTMAPSDATAKSGGSSNDGTLKAPRATSNVFVTLRAFQLVPDEDLGEFVYNPDPAENGDPPSLALVPQPCDPASGDPDCAVAAAAPDLVPELGGAEVLAKSIGEGGGLEVAAGATFAFPPGGWTLRNVGNTAATAENRDLRHGFYLCSAALVEDTPDEVVFPVGDCVPLLGSQPSAFDTLSPNGTEAFSPATLTVPQDVTPGDYSIVLFVDDLFEVSESDEVNNEVALPVTVVAAPVELLGNGSFELPVVSGSWGLFTSVDSWYIEWVDQGTCGGGAPRLEIQRGEGGAYDGSQFVELDTDCSTNNTGNPARVRISQTFETCAASSYTVSFAWRQRTVGEGLEGNMTVTWGDQQFVYPPSGQQSGTWNPVTLVLSAEQGATQLSFEEAGPADSFGMFLDAVSVVGPSCQYED